MATAPELKVWEIQDDTGKSYKVEGPVDATPDELFDAVEQLYFSSEAPATPEPEAPAPAPASAPVQQPQQPVSTPEPVAPPQARGETSARFFDTDATNPFRQEAARETDVLAQMLQDPQYSEDDIRAFAQKSPFRFEGLEENLVLRAQGKPTGTPALDESFFTMFEQPEAPNVEEGDRGALERFADSWTDATQYGFPGLVGRTLHDWLDTSKDQIKEIFPGRSEEWYEEMQEYAVNATQKKLREEAALLQEADPNWRPDESFLDAALSPERWGPWFLGQIAGSMGPEQALLPGASAVQRAAGQAAIGAASDVGYQAADISAGVSDEFSPASVALNAALGAGGEVLLEGAARSLSRNKAGTGQAPRYDQTISVPTSRRGTKKFQEQLGQAQEEVINRVNNLTQEWTNAPTYEVHTSFKDVDGIDDDAIGVFVGDNKVLLNTDAILKEAKRRKVTPDDITASVTFHEGLGHHGLAQQFGDELDSVLENFYDRGNSDFTRQVDEWLELNPSAYANDSNRLARAAEEVLAEWSEKGEIPVGMMDQIKNLIKKYARQFGLDLNFSEREIKTILGMAHSAVTSGKGRDVRGNGFRYRDPSDDDLIQLRRKKIKEATEKLSSTKPGETQTLRPFEQEEPDYWRFRHVTDDGKVIKGTYTVENGLLDNFSIDAEGGPRSIGPRAIRKVGRDLLARHPEAQRIAGYRISGARPNEQYAQSGNRFMKPTTEPTSAGFKRPRMDYRRRVDDKKLRREARAAYDPFAEPSFEVDSPNARFMRPSAREIEATEALTPDDLTADELFESQNALDILNRITKDVESSPMTMDELRSEALARGMSPRQLLNVKDGPGDLTRRLFMYDIAADKVQDKLTKLYGKIQSGRFTVRDKDNYLATLTQFDELAGKIFGQQSEAGRMLRAIQDMNFTRRKVEGVKNILGQLDNTNPFKGLEDDEVFARFAKEVQEQLADSAAERPGKVKSFVSNALNLPRALMSSFDLSAPLRQGIFFLRRKEFWRALPRMFAYFASESSYKNLMSDIMNRNTYPLMVESNLALTSREGNLSKREEDFMTDWAGKIPLVGRGVKASERAYAGFLNKLRADVFDDLVSKMERRGIEIADDKKALKDLGGYISNATGRGDLGKLNGSAPLLTALFFSPRLMASRVRLLNPAYYVSLSPEIRKEALLDLLTFGSIATTVLGLAHLGGASVEADPRSSDFGKIRVGDTRYDALGGFAQYITLGARLATNETKTSTGNIKEYKRGYGQTSRFDALSKFLTNKASPNASYVIDYLRDENAIGEPFDPVDSTVQRFVPMFLQDLQEAKEEFGAAEGTARVLPAVFGVSVNTYKPYNLDPDKEIEAPESFKDKDIPDGENDFVSVKDGTVTLKGEAREEWQNTLNFYIEEWMKDEMAKPEWETMTDNERAEVIKAVRSDARKQTKQDMLPLLGLEE